MNYKTILLEHKKNIGIIKLNDVHRRNALSRELITELIDALQELDANRQVYVIVIMSNVSGVFCAGRDLSERDSIDMIKQREFSSGPANLWLLLQSIRKVVIAAVNGFALAGGCGLAVCCDLVIASEDATFGLPEIDVGLFPVTVGPAMIRNIQSLKKCFELFVTGDRFNAMEAQRIGIVNKVVRTDELDAATIELANKIASKSPTILQMGKEFFYTVMDMDYKSGIMYAKELISIMASTGDSIEGQKAFLEKRKPRWKN